MLNLCFSITGLTLEGQEYSVKHKGLMDLILIYSNTEKKNLGSTESFAKIQKSCYRRLNFQLIVSGTCFTHYRKKSYYVHNLASYFYINIMCIFTRLFQVDLQTLCGMVPIPLNQGVLLALFQQLACDICQRYHQEASMDDKCCCGNTTNRSNDRYACKANI